MAKLRSEQSVRQIVKDIKDEEFQLPSIQRPFVWEPEQTLKLLDSIMCEYPIGALMVWKPSGQVRCRPFIKDYLSGKRKISQLPPPNEKPSYMVLDGQQRLQSLYLSFYGTYDKKRIYLRLDAMADKSEDDLNYRFEWLTNEEAGEDKRYVFIGELAEVEIEEIDEFVSDRCPDLNAEEKKLAIKICGRFVNRFVVKEPVLIQEISEKLDYNEVLEVFERVNSGGTPLSKSDLLFSTVSLKVPEIEDRFNKILDELNQNGKFDFNTDFLIKTTFVIFGKKAKYDHKKLADEKYIQALSAGFDNLEKVMDALRVFLEDNACIKASRFLRSKNALIPIIDFLYQNQKWLGADEGEESQQLLQYLYMAFFARMYSRAPDSIIDQCHDKIVAAKPAFPLDEMSKLLVKREKRGTYEFRDEYLTQDLDLVLNIIDGGVLEIPRKRTWSLERDHIFPQHKLKEAGIVDDVHDVGNFRLLGKSRNISKSDTMPDQNTEFFGSNDDELKKLFEVAVADFNQTNFTAFVNKRHELIFNKVANFLGFPVSVGV